MNTHPNQHPAWLAAMGVSQWQLREPVAQDTSKNWPEPLLNATHWLVGEPLNPAGEALLHAIMAAIGVSMSDVVYCADEATLHLALPVPEHVKLLRFGAVACAWQGGAGLDLPSIAAMQEQFALKREAWTILKNRLNKPLRSTVQ
ncbi:MAG: DNA polymerase III subunit psi [Formosimonas sp.]